MSSPDKNPPKPYEKHKKPSFGSSAALDILDFFKDKLDFYLRLAKVKVKPKALESNRDRSISLINLEVKVKVSSGEIMTFYLKQCIGVENSSVTYSAKDEQGNGCCFKVEENDKQFADESEIITELQGLKCGIPKLICYGKIKDTNNPIIVTDIVGTPLYDLLQDSVLSIRKAVALGEQMISILEQIHKRDIVHRDIKPGIILKKNEEDFFITDFGSAINWYKAISNEEPVGNIEFSSINSMTGNPVGPSDDLESLAYVLIYSLTGSLPWSKLLRAEYEVAQICSAKLEFVQRPREFTKISLPDIFYEFLLYTYTLKYDQKPDYYTWNLKFKSLKNEVDVIMLEYF